jgi:DNA-binding transcriptional ArsR family regulator
MRDVQGRSQLLPLLRTPLLGEVLSWLYLHPEDTWSVTDLARRFKVSQSTVSREADRLVGADLITELRRGNLRLLQANVHGPLVRPLTELLALTYGPIAVLGEVLADIPGVDEAFIYGSWAARYQGEPGSVPRDIDVLVVGDADDNAVFAAARAAERRLGREVNTHRVTARGWREVRDDPFLASVRSRPIVSIDLGRTADELGAGSGRD